MLTYPVKLNIVERILESYEGSYLPNWAINQATNLTEFSKQDYLEIRGAWYIEKKKAEELKIDIELMHNAAPSLYLEDPMSYIEDFSNLNHIAEVLVEKMAAQGATKSEILDSLAGMSDEVVENYLNENRLFEDEDYMIAGVELGSLVHYLLN